MSARVAVVLVAAGATVSLAAFGQSIGGSQSGPSVVSLVIPDGGITVASGPVQLQVPDGGLRVTLGDAVVPVSGSVAATISGPVAVTGIVTSTLSGPVALAVPDGGIQVSLGAAVVPVTGNVGVTGPVSVTGTVGVAGTVPVSGSVGITGPVSVTGSVTSTLSGPVSINAPANGLRVSLGSDTIPVSGSVIATLAVPDGGVPVSISGTLPVTVASGNFELTQSQVAAIRTTPPCTVYRTRRASLVGNVVANMNGGQRRTEITLRNLSTTAVVSCQTGDAGTPDCATPGFGDTLKPNDVVRYEVREVVPVTCRPCTIAALMEASEALCEVP